MKRVLAGALRAVALLAAALPFAACGGDGSDIGPRLDRLPETTAKVQVLDDQNRGVAGARVVVDSLVARTGRSGRGDLLGDPRGPRLVQVLTDAASATASDRLVPLWLRVDLPGGEIPFAVHVPDTGASSALGLGVGTQFGQQFVETQSGATLEWQTGTRILNAFEATVALRVGTLQTTHLPPGLPPPPAGTWLLGRGYYVDPPTVTFAPAAALEVPDELALPSGGTATLFWLDPFTGTWTEVAGVATASGGRLRHPDGVAAGGLYVFATAVPAAVVTGRVVDTKNNPLLGAQVRVDAAIARTGTDGRFSVADVAGTLADGTARPAAIEVRGGAQWLPVAATAATPQLGAGGTADVALTLDTVPAGNVRMQMIVRGREEPFRRLGLSTEFGNVASVAFGDERGQLTFENVPNGHFGTITAKPMNDDDLQQLRALGLFQFGRPWLDLSAFFDERPWFIGSRSSRVQVIDAVGTGPVRDAVVTTGATPGVGFAAGTAQDGIVFVDRSGQRVTAVAQTTVEGRTVTSAFSVEDSNGDQLEMPIVRALRTPAGAFDRHALVAGTLLGADTGAELAVRGTRLTSAGEWFDAVLRGVPIESSLPVKVDPLAPAGTFRVGVGMPRGHLVATQGATAAGVYTLHRAGIAADLDLPEAETTARDLALDLVAGSTFTASGLLAALDPAFTAADLRVDLALLQPSLRVVDVARGIGGNHSASGQDLLLLLPPLTALPGHEWLVAVGAANASQSQRAVLRFDTSGTAAVPLLPLPQLTAPADGATVPSDGFVVQFALPAGTLYATLDLASPGTSALFWNAVVPGDQTSFAFVRLPPEAKPVLVAGRTYTLTLTAWRADEGIGVTGRDPYRDVTTFWQSIDLAQRGARALSSRTITLTVN